MQPYDWIMLVVIGVAVLFGAWKGLAWQIASIAAIVVSYLVAMRLRGPIAELISVDPPLNGFIALFLVYALCSLGIWIAFGFVRSFIDRFHLKSFDRQAGALLGAVKGAALCILITLFAVTLLGQTRRQQVCQSQSGRFIAQTIDQLRGLVPKEIHPVIEPYLKKFDDAMAETGSGTLQPAAANGHGGQAGSIGSNLAEDIRSAAREYFGKVIPTSGETTGELFQGTLQGVAPSEANRSIGWPSSTPPARRAP